MKFAIDGHAGEDWGAPDLSTGYVYRTVVEAEEAAQRWMRDTIAAGMPEDYVGCYVISDEQDAGENPIVEDLYKIDRGALVNTDAERRGES
jgi:hypothetical protein